MANRKQSREEALLNAVARKVGRAAGAIAKVTKSLAASLPVSRDHPESQPARAKKKSQSNVAKKKRASIPTARATPRKTRGGARHAARPSSKNAAPRR